jgi:hypothetical protein
MQKVAWSSDGRGSRDGNSTGNLARRHIDAKQFQYLHYTEVKTRSLLLAVYFPTLCLVNDHICNVARHYYGNVYALLLGPIIIIILSLVLTLQLALGLLSWHPNK